MFKKLLIVVFIILSSISISTKFVYAESGSINESVTSGEGTEILNTIVKTTGQKEVSNLPTMASNLIKIFLGAASSIFLIFMIVGGFKYLGSKGDTKKIGDSLKLIETGAIGLAIILLAYSITRFVLTQITKIGG